MNELLATRLRSIRDTLLGQYRGGAGLPKNTSGGERETFLDHFLRDVLLPVYRFGRGVIIDAAGNQSGALDLVMELPFGPTFPMPGGNHRLYLADSIAAVIEVKSNLVDQWQQVEATLAKVRPLTRDLRQSSGLLLEGSPKPEPTIELGPHVPCYAVGYTGHATLGSLRERLKTAAIKPDGALVIESGAYVGPTGSAEGPEGLYHFVADLVMQANAVLQIAYPSLFKYLTAMPGG
jgi:hypothetical protein